MIVILSCCHRAIRAPLRAASPEDDAVLTRIEIDGFKSFDKLQLDLQPFTVVAGANASGKSNFFDALRLLSKLATEDISGALRGTRGEPSELPLGKRQDIVADAFRD